LISQASQHLELGSEEPLWNILLEYEKKLNPLMGVLSRFIIKKEYEKISHRERINVDENTLVSISRSILDNVSILIGPKKTDELEEEIRIINREYLEEVDEND